MWERGSLELTANVSGKTSRSCGHWELFKEAIAYPVERLSRTDRTVLKTAVTGSFAEVIASGQ
jgi:hypothetical protein